MPVRGYEIHHGRTRSTEPVDRDRRGGPDGREGARTDGGRIAGTSLHGLLEADGFRAAFLTDVARRAGHRWNPGGVSFAAAREARFDRLAEALEEHLDLGASGAPDRRGAGPARPHRPSLTAPGASLTAPGADR